MEQDELFAELVEKGHPVGEIVGVDTFLIKIRGLQPCNVHALVRFEDGSKGYVHHVYEDHVVVMKLGTTVLSIGMICVVQHSELLAKVGKNYIGRVVNDYGEPIDGKGPLVVSARRVSARVWTTSLRSGSRFAPGRGGQISEMVSAVFDTGQLGNRL